MNVGVTYKLVALLDVLFPEFKLDVVCLLNQVFPSNLAQPFVLG